MSEIYSVSYGVGNYMLVVTRLFNNQVFNRVSAGDVQASRAHINDQGL